MDYSKSAAGYTSQGVENDDNLFAGEFPRVTRKVTVISGQNLTRGALLGRITASDKYNLSLSAAADGSQTPRAILAHDVDASGGDKEAIVYESGEFNLAAMTIGTAHTAATVADGLRGLGIYLRTNYAA